MASLPILLDADECIKKAEAYIDMANLMKSAKLQSECLEIAAHHTQLAEAIQRSPKLRSELEK